MYNFFPSKNLSPHWHHVKFFAHLTPSPSFSPRFLLFTIAKHLYRTVKISPNLLSTLIFPFSNNFPNFHHHPPTSSPASATTHHKLPLNLPPSNHAKPHLKPHAIHHPTTTLMRHRNLPSEMQGGKGNKADDEREVGGIGGGMRGGPENFLARRWRG